MSANLLAHKDVNDSAEREVLACVEVLQCVQVTGLREGALKELLRSARRVQAGVDALIWRVGAEADRLATNGHSAPAEELLGEGGQVRASTAKKDAERSRTVHEISGLRKAATTGNITPDHVDSLTRRFRNLTPDERQQLDHKRITEKAPSMGPDQFDRLVKGMVDRVRQDHGLKDAQQKRETSEFQHWFDHKTGMGKFSGQLDPERYEALTTAIDQHTTTLALTEGEHANKNSNLAAAALVELICNSRERSPKLPHITVVVDQKTLAVGAHNQSIRETGNGLSVPPETVERHACDAVLQRVTLDKRGVPINVGRKYRTATNAQWTALKAIHSECAWAKCQRPLSWCQLHHITEWKDGGSTDIDNLVPLCSTHHHRVHEGKWAVKLKPDRSLEIFKPDKQLHQTVAPPTRRTPDMAEATLERQVDESLLEDHNLDAIVPEWQ